MDSNGSTAQFRIETLEKIVQNLVPTKEFELYVKMQKESSDRIEQSVTQILAQQNVQNEKINEMELRNQQRDAAQQKAIADLHLAIASIQVRLFYAIMSLAGAVLVGVAIYYFTHPH